MRSSEFLDVVSQAAQTAAVHADEVDRQARFPHEAMDLLSTGGALAALVPSALGGAEVPLEAVAGACLALGRACAATAMVFAMHTIQVACLVRHSGRSPWLSDYLEQLVREPRLIASATSEVATGGNLGASSAALEEHGGQLRFEKQAPTISYGGHADDVLTTLRRGPDAEPGDQVAVLTQAGQHQLTQVGSWDPLGMRGTCSPGFVVSAVCGAEQVLADPFDRISAVSMVPISHVLWSHVWLGIATEAFERARAFTRAAALKDPAGTDALGRRLSLMLGDLSQLRGAVAAGLIELTAATAADDFAALQTLAAALRFNTLKTTASVAAPQVCASALALCGIAGYRNDTPYSVGRHLRDALSASVMVANDRLHSTNARLLLVVKEV